MSSSPTKSEHIWTSLLRNDSEIKRRISEKYPQSAKGLRYAKVGVKGDLERELLAGVNALLRSHGTEITTVISSDMLHDCVAATEIALFDKEKYQLKSDEHYIYVGKAVTKIVYARATLKDGSIIDPCIIYPSKTDIANVLGFYSFFIAGGSVKALERSPYMLPPAVITKAAQTPDAFRDMAQPLLVSIHGKEEYLVDPSTVFFEYEDLQGKDVSQDSGKACSKADSYIRGSSMLEKITIILGDIPGVNEVIFD